MPTNGKILWVKCACYLTIGVFTPWASSLAQWANSEQLPSKFIWLGVILPASLMGGASQLLSFLSSSYGKYQQEQKDKEATQFITKP